MVLAALLIFVVTLTFVIWQPRGLGIGWSASGGALLALLLGVVSFGDVAAVTGIVWNATLAFIAIILISLVLDEIGFFEWAALHMARLAGGDGKRMFVYAVLLGAAVTGLFANDGAALILTPIVLAMIRALHFPEKMILPYVMASGFIADTASTPLVISNLVNIMSADYFGIGFLEYAGRMIVPTLVSTAASLLVLYAYYRKQIPERFDASMLRPPAEAIRDPFLFRWSWGLLGLLLAAYLIGGIAEVPVSFIAGAGALLFLLLARRSQAVDAWRIVKGAPWAIVFFSVGMYVVVYGLRNAGLTDLLGGLIGAFAEHGLFAASVGMGFVSAILSSVMNNLPTVMIGALAIDASGSGGTIREALAYANVIGSDLGPKMTPLGSLATLLWLHVLSRKGIRITWGYYFKVGVLLTVPTLLATLAALWAWLALLT